MATCFFLLVKTSTLPQSLKKSFIDHKLIKYCDQRQHVGPHQQQLNQQTLGASEKHLLTTTKYNVISNNKQSHNKNITKSTINNTNNKSDMKCEFFENL